MMAAALLFVLKGLLAQPSARGVLSCAAQLVVSIFLLQTWIPSSRFWFCLNGVAWYLSVQAFLYAIFPPLLAVLKKADARRLRCIAAVIFCVQCLASFVFWKVGLSGKAAFYLTYLCPDYIMGTAVNTTLIAGVFRAGGDTKFGLVCDTIDMWCYAVPLGFIAAFVFKLPVLVVYFLLCTDEFVKWPWVLKRYKSGLWAKNITRDHLFEDEEKE